VKHPLRLFLIFMILLISLPAVTSYAIHIPDKDGHVLDTASMLSSTARFSLEHEAAQGPLAFYIVTLNSLNGDSPSQAATAIYQQWKLGSDEVLILISQQDQRIEMNFNNPALQEQMDAVAFRASGSAALKQFIDTHFIPYAKKGDFAKAVSELMSASNALAANIGNMNNGLTPVGQPHGQQSSSSWLWIVLVIAIGLLSLIILYLVRMMQTVKRLQTDIPSLMVQTNHALESIRTIRDLSQGATLQQATEAGAKSEKSIIRLHEMKQYAASIGWQQCLQPRTRSELKRLNTELQAMTQETQQLTAQIEHIQQLDLNLKRTIADAAQRIEHVSTSIQADQASRGWPLEELLRRQEAISAELLSSKQLEVFDPIQSEQRVIHVNEEIQRLEQDQQSVSKYAEQYQRFPEQMNQSRNSVSQIAEEHRLKLVRIDPYGKIEEAQQSNEQMLDRLKLGDIPATAQHAERASLLLAEAVQITQRLADLKLKNARDIQSIETKLSQYAAQDRELSALTARAQTQYRGKHWEQAWRQYREELQAVDTVQSALRRVTQWCDEDVQEYEQARSELDHILALLQKLDQAAEQYNDLIHKLDRKLKEAKQMQASAEDSFAQGLHTIDRHRIYSNWQQQEKSLAAMQSSIRQLLAQQPYDMDLLTDTGTRFLNEANQFLSAIERAAVQKQNVEQELARMEQRYRSSSAKYGSRLNVHQYGSQFSSISTDVDRLMHNGAYDEAARKAAALSGILTAMEQAYESIIRQERQQEEAAARQAANRNTSNNSSGGSSWGNNNNSNSSGGSSW